MTLALFVLPVLDRALGLDAMLSLGAHCDGVRIKYVDNTIHNVGVAAAWNQGAREVLDGAADWLVVWSEAVTFGASHGVDFLDVLADPPYRYSADSPVGDAPWMIAGIGLGWHLCAIHSTVLAHVGIFDEAFFAYYEDQDWIYRHKLSGLGDLREVGHTAVPVDVGSWLGDAHSIRMGLADPDLGAAALTYVDKWGGYEGREVYTHPYNRPDLDWRAVR